MYLGNTVFWFPSCYSITECFFLKFNNFNFPSPGLSKFCENCPVDISPFKYTHILAVSFFILSTSNHDSDNRTLNAGGSVAHAFCHLPQSCEKYVNSQATFKTSSKQTNKPNSFLWRQTDRHVSNVISHIGHPVLCIECAVLWNFSFEHSHQYKIKFSICFITVAHVR